MAIAPANFSKLEKRVQQLYDLYTKHFKRELSLTALRPKLEDKKFRKQLNKLGGPGGETNFQHPKFVYNTDYAQNSIKKFIREAKRKGLIDDVIGQGALGLVVLLREGDEQVVIKLPVHSFTDFDGDGHISFELEHDHVQTVAEIEGIDHQRVSQPVDGLSIRGKMLAFGFIPGVTYLSNKESINESGKGFQRILGLRELDPSKMAELIKVYAETHKQEQSIICYGATRNTMLSPERDAFTIYDLCPEPPTKQEEILKLKMEQRLFAGKHLAAAIYQVISNGNIGFYSNSYRKKYLELMLPKICGDEGKAFYEYRERLLIDSLQVLLDQGYIERDELLANIEHLRDLNPRILADDLRRLRELDYFGKLSDRAEALLERSVQHFRV